jgi:hypothetical protein
MIRARIVGISLFGLIAGALLAAQAFAPVVTMSITLPDGQIQHLTAAESGLATLTLKNGSTWGFRPTILDSRPWTKVTVTIFKMGPAESEAGEVQLTTGGAGITSKTTPEFKVAITKVEPPTGVLAHTT